MTNPPSSGIGGRIARGSALSFLSGILSRSATLAQSIVIARWLDPYRVGVFAVLSYVLSVAGALSDIGMPAAAMKLIAECAAGRRDAVKSLVLTLSGAMLTMACLTGLILVFASDLLAFLYREPSLALLFKLGALLLFLSLLGGFLSGVLQGFQQIDALAVLGPVKAFTVLVLTLLLLPPFGLVGVLAASIVAEPLVWLLAAKPVRRMISPYWSSQRASPSWATLRGALHLALPLFLNGLTLWGTPWLLRSYLARIRGYADVGLYQVADAFSRILLFIPSAVAVPFVPAVSEFSAVAPVQVSGLARTTLRLATLVTLPAALFLFLAARPLLAVLYGSAYAEAGSLASLLVMAAFFQAAGVIVWSVLVGTGRIWAGFLIQSTGQLLLVALGFVLVPRFGLAGLGISHIAAYGASVLVGLFYLAARLGVTLEGLKALLPVGLWGWLVAWSLHLVGAAGILEALLVALGILAWEAFQLRPEERASLTALIRQLRPKGVEKRGSAGLGSGCGPRGE
jgi:O-antigen/teichoic acid export membrane protein